MSEPVKNGWKATLRKARKSPRKWTVSNINRKCRMARKLAILILAIYFLYQLKIPISGQAPAPKIIENPENPKYSGKDAPQLLFEKELSIPLEGRRYSFDVDEEGQIYLLDTRGASISVYDRSGKLVTRFGRKGQGPGEFENPAYLAVSKEKKIHVVDRSRRMIQVFDKKGTLLAHQEFSSMGNDDPSGVRFAKFCLYHGQQEPLCPPR